MPRGIGLCKDVASVGLIDCGRREISREIMSMQVVMVYFMIQVTLYITYELKLDTSTINEICQYLYTLTGHILE